MLDMINLTNGSNGAGHCKRFWVIRKNGSNITSMNIKAAVVAVGKVPVKLKYGIAT